MSKKCQQSIHIDYGKLFTMLQSCRKAKETVLTQTLMAKIAVGHCLCFDELFRFGLGRLDNRIKKVLEELVWNRVPGGIDGWSIDIEHAPIVANRRLS